MKSPITHGISQRESRVNPSFGQTLDKNPRGEACGTCYELHKPSRAYCFCSIVLSSSDLEVRLVAASADERFDSATCSLASVMRFSRRFHWKTPSLKSTWQEDGKRSEGEIGREGGKSRESIARLHCLLTVALHS